MRRLSRAVRTFVPVAATFLAATIPATTTARADAQATGSKLETPSRITSAKGVRGPHPGETTIRWRTSGRHTDYFRIATALTPFGSGHGKGRHHRSFVVRNPDRRSFTLSRDQTARAGAGLRTGRRLFFRISAVNRAGSRARTKPYRHLRHATITGQGSRMNGARLRFAQYNVRVQASDIPGHRWKDRQYLVARQIASVHPMVMGVQELMPAMWTEQDGGIGLNRALARTGVGDYHLTRRTGYFRHAAQDSRILYDANQVRMTSKCPQTRPSCYIALPSRGRRQVAVFARFVDLSSGQPFYFVTAHLTAGNDRATDRLRGRQARAISAKMRRVNQHHLPMMLTMDANSSQTSKGVDAPHNALVNAGWYNSIAAAQTENVQYNSVQHFRVPQRPSPYGFGSMYDTLMTRFMPGADLFKQVLATSPAPSDHNIVFADVRLPHH